MGEAVVDGRLAPATNPENLSCGRARIYTRLFIFLSRVFKELN